MYIYDCKSKYDIIHIESYTYVLHVLTICVFVRGNIVEMFARHTRLQDQLQFFRSTKSEKQKKT